MGRCFASHVALEAGRRKLEGYDSVITKAALQIHQSSGAIRFFVVSAISEDFFRYSPRAYLEADLKMDLEADLKMALEADLEAALKMAVEADLEGVLQKLEGYNSFTTKAALQMLEGSNSFRRMPLYRGAALDATIEAALGAALKAALEAALEKLEGYNSSTAKAALQLLQYYKARRESARLMFFSGYSGRKSEKAQEQEDKAFKEHLELASKVDEGLKKMQNVDGQNLKLFPDHNGSLQCTSSESDIRIDIFHENDNQEGKTRMPDVSSLATDSTVGSSSGCSEFTCDGWSHVPTVANRIHVGEHLNQQGTSEGAEVTHASFVIPKDGDHPAMPNDCPHDHQAVPVKVNDHPDETKFLTKRNITILGVTAAAALVGVSSSSSDSPFLPFVEAGTGTGFLGSFLALCVLKVPKIARILSKTGTIGAASAVIIALGLYFPKDTIWNLHIVAIVAACLTCAVMVARS